MGCWPYNGSFPNGQGLPSLNFLQRFMNHPNQRPEAHEKLDKKARLREDALRYHEFPQPGKVTIAPTKQMVSQYDLALAYSPGVAIPCEEIEKDPAAAYKYTSKGNLVAVITNGTAVLGLGDIGPLAGKPVMEGKGVLFKKFSGIDVFDLEIDEKDPDKLIEIIAALEPTFGGINLEDIKAPDCFYIERKLRERMKIPVFHDDQHGTAIVVGAAVLNGLKVQGKKIEEVKLAASGAGAAAQACLHLLIKLGMKRENIWVCDSRGLIHERRKDSLDAEKAYFMQTGPAETLADCMQDADVFLGLSGAGVVSQDMVKVMADKPMILGLANPIPEIMPEDILAVRDDALIATGRSDYPNQVNNVLCFPYIFRGALDSGATSISKEMEVAAVHAIAELAQAEQNEVVAAAYAGETLHFGPEYLIPKPFDPRLMERIAPAVAQAAADSGVAQRPIADMEHYIEHLKALVHASGTLMKPVIAAAKKATKKRICYCEGEEERVLRAAQIVSDENIARPILIGRPAIIRQRIERFGLRLEEGRDYDVVNTEMDDRYRGFWQEYHRMIERKGGTVQLAKIEMRRRLTLIGAMMLHTGQADGLICGTWATTALHLKYIDQVIGKRRDARLAVLGEAAEVYACMNGLILPNHQVFIVDTHVNDNPTAEQLCAITMMAAEQVRRFGIEPKVALLSHSNFGESDAPSAVKMRRTLALLKEHAPELDVEGEMHGDVALDLDYRKERMPNFGFEGEANILIMPNLDAANIAYNLLKTTAGGNVAIGPILLGCNAPVHVLTPSAPVRRIVNMTAIAVGDANCPSGELC